jgi:phenol/toluene 2-monooxygenase (NADH) P5/A5
VTYTLTIEPLGETVEVAEGQTMLDACLRSGIYLPHACGHGLCGSCKVDVVDGDVDHGAANSFALMDFEREGGKTLACSASLNSDVTIEADIEPDPDARRIPVRDFKAQVAAVEDLTRDVKLIRLSLNGGKIDFQAGQFISLDIPGVEGSRAFSLANPPQAASEVELQVRLVEGGKGTTYLHKELKAGDAISFSGPYGRFLVRKSRGGPLLFLAGGTGVSSPRSMILDLLSEGYSDKITLIHGVRTQADLYGREEFERLAGRHPNFTYVPALSAEPAESPWQGQRGFVHEAAQRQFNSSFEGQTAYLCGPPPMIEACISVLMQGRLFEKHIFLERFLTQGDAAARPKSPVFKRI